MCWPRFKAQGLLTQQFTSRILRIQSRSLSVTHMQEGFTCMFVTQQIDRKPGFLDKTSLKITDIRLRVSCGVQQTPGQRQASGYSINHPLLEEKKKQLCMKGRSVSYNPLFCSFILEEATTGLFGHDSSLPQSDTAYCCLRSPKQEACVLCSRLMARFDQHLWPK